MKSRNLNTYICSRIETYSDSKRDLSFKGDVIYQRPLVSQKQGQISFNDFNNILTEFGGESIIQSPTYHTTSKKEKKQCQDLNQYQVKSQKSYSEHLAQEEAIKKLLLEKKTNQPNQQNQCTIQLRNKTVRSLYYDQKEANQSEQSNLDQLIQMSFHLGYKKTHQVTKLNQRALKNNQELNLQNCLVQNLFCTKSPQNFRNKIDQFEIRRRFDNYTFRLEKTERSSSSTKQSNKKKVLKFLDEHSQRSVEISDSFDSNECVQNNFMKRQTSNKTLNIHTQVKKQINRFVTPREQKEFKSTLQSFSNQQRVLNESLAFGNTTQQSINMNSPISKESKEYLLQLIEKPHQKELRNRIASFIKQKEQIKDIQKQADPQLRITKSFLSQKQIKQRTDNQLQSPLFNPNFSQIQNNTSYQAENISQICFLKGGLSVDGNSEDFSQFDSINNKQPEQNKTQTSYFLSKSYSNKSNPFLKKILNNQQKKYQNTISKNFENKINDSDLQLKDIFNTTNLSKINESTPMKRQDSLSDFLKISQIIESPKQPKFIQKINIIQ